MLKSALCIEVLDAFSALVQALNELKDAIENDRSLVAWVQGDNNAPREKAIAAFQQLQYLDSQAPREIYILAGFLGASARTIHIATKVNTYKNRFKNSILALKPLKIAATDPELMQQFGNILNHRQFSTSATLKKLGLARLHLKQCYRKIPILSAAPQKISWTWAHTKAIKKISIEKAQELLIKKGADPGIQMQLQKLACLSPQESLAIVQELAPHLRANIVFDDNEIQKRIMIKGPIPILFPCALKTPYPQFNPPTEKSPRSKTRAKRSDIMIEEAAFLPAIRAHRYEKLLFPDRSLVDQIK